jgi:hypothetical protein
MMTPAQMFAPLIDATNEKIQARLDNAVNLDISLYNNAVAVPGTAVMPLIQDASTNKLAILVQTRAQKGIVVNYGLRLRDPIATDLMLSNYAYAGVTGAGAGGAPIATNFERHFCSPVSVLFGVRNTAGSCQMGTNEITLADGGGTWGNAHANEWYIFCTDLTAVGRKSPGVDREIRSQGGDPLLSFWDPFVKDYEYAVQRGRTYDATGYLFTNCILRSNMPTNDNRAYSLTQGSPYYVNPSSTFYTTYVLDSTQAIVGMYIEEHGCDISVGILGEAMKAAGYITDTF